ncbi:SDR family oxidoreductase [Thiomicrorhabdus sp. Milos-T2]|uniref:UDP-glucose 4-epimerase family protein n=1 Tax=Thiomicrorhabdus sp. Milos-T2 TaxID=90814 RepID=UPI000493DEAE|nr:SDR family oxidoreductase [Thiomicrorhabdus sp. Milos-T2]
MNYLITGATGFVGQALVKQLQSDNSNITAILRQPLELLNAHADVVIGDLSTMVGFFDVLHNQEVVIHLAARVHMMNDDPKSSLVAYRQLNTDVTVNLARQASKAGVKRFVFLSSIKVNGEFTRPGNSFLPDDKYIPTNPYGLSKYEAEQGLLKIAEETGMEVVIIRPPLVYGPGVKANFASMMNWVNKGVPLPFGAVHNKRSLVALDNLVDFIALCADREKSPKAANQVFLISDGEDVSTTQLLQKVAKAFNKKARLLPIPVGLMIFMAKLLGKGVVANRLFGSLQVDSSKARVLLDWKPVTTMDEQLKKTAESFKNNHEDTKRRTRL